MVILIKDVEKFISSQPVQLRPYLTAYFNKYKNEPIYLLKKD